MLATETVAGLQVRSSPALFAHFVLGVTPHTTQAAFLECRAPVKVAACGRRWGKSTAAALDALHLAVVGDGEGRPTTQMVVAPTADQIIVSVGRTVVVVNPSPPCLPDFFTRRFLLRRSADRDISRSL